MGRGLWGPPDPVRPPPLPRASRPSRLEPLLKGPAARRSGPRPKARPRSRRARGGGGGRRAERGDRRPWASGTLGRGRAPPLPRSRVHEGKPRSRGRGAGLGEGSAGPRGRGGGEEGGEGASPVTGAADLWGREAGRSAKETVCFALGADPAPPPTPPWGEWRCPPDHPPPPRARFRGPVPRVCGHTPNRDPPHPQSPHLPEGSGRGPGPAPSWSVLGGGGGLVAACVYRTLCERPCVSRSSALSLRLDVCVSCERLNVWTESFLCGSTCVCRVCNCMYVCVYTSVSTPCVRRTCVSLSCIYF